MKTNLTKRELKEELEKREILDRKMFLNVYSEFDNWLRSIGFRAGHYWKECATSLDFHYSHYDNDINSLYGVECYMNDTLKLAIRFLRDRNEHKFMFVGEMGASSEVYSIEKTKELILSQVRELRDEKLSKLKELENI